MGTDVLPYLVSSPPVAVSIVDTVRMEDFLGGPEDELGRDLRAVGTTARVCCHLCQLNIKANHLVFSRDDHQAAALDRVDGAPHADVG